MINSKELGVNENIAFTFHLNQGIQRPGKPGNVREFRRKEKKSGNLKKKNKKSQGILLCEIHFQSI